MTVEPTLRVFGRVDLDGTHRAVFDTDDGVRDNSGEEIYLELSNDRGAICCMSRKVPSGGGGRILVDRYKLWNLDLKDGDQVAARVIDPPAAGRIVLRTGSEVTPRDAVRFIGKPLRTGERTAFFNFSGEPRLFTISAAEPEGIVRVTAATEIAMAESPGEEALVSYKDIGGLSREIKQIREIVEYPLRFPEIFEHLGVTPPRGIILHGPPGTGKTLIARALANEVGARFYTISGPEVYSKWYGRSEQNLRNIFEDAVRNAPAVVVIDELDALVPRRDRTHGDQEQRIVATFLTQMDGLKELRDVVVVGTTNRINWIDPALRRGGRFEREILVGVPDPGGRQEILEIHTRRMPVEEDIDLKAVAERAGGFVGADLASLCREAAYNALRRSASPEVFEEGGPMNAENIRVKRADFDAALRTVPPSAGREFTLEVPPVTWEDVGGLEETKRILIENISHGITRREAFDRVGVRPASGILLYGPPGTGKTLLARAVACECGANFIAVKGSEIRRKWLGESEDQVRFLFARARLLAPCVIFFDEIDTALPVRGRDITGTSDSIVNQILAEMDGIEDLNDVFVMGATNRIDALDPAALRPGRFDFQVEIPLPDIESRKAIFEVHFRSKPLGKDVDPGALARDTEGFSGAQIAEVCREAALMALRHSDYDPERVVVEARFLLQALERIARSFDRREGGAR